MLGYDRPLKPEWIYKSLRMVEPGRKPEEFYDAYNDIATELTGKHGRRKTRTVLFRTFIYSFQESKSTIEDNILIQLSKKHDFEYMKPIYMAMFMMHYDIFRSFTKTYFQIFDASQEISSTALTKKMTESFGDSEIVKRSTRAFLKTLSDFHIIEPITKASYEQLNKATISKEQVADILKLYAVVNHTKQINIGEFDKTILAYYNAPTLSEVAHSFHAKDWEYIKGHNRELLMMN